MHGTEPHCSIGWQSRNSQSCHCLCMQCVGCSEEHQGLVSLTMLIEVHGALQPAVYSMLQVCHAGRIHPWVIGGYWALPLQYFQNGLVNNEFTAGQPVSLTATSGSPASQALCEIFGLLLQSCCAVRWTFVPFWLHSCERISMTGVCLCSGCK